MSYGSKDPHLKVGVDEGGLVPGIVLEGGLVPIGLWANGFIFFLQELAPEPGPPQLGPLPLLGFGILFDSIYWTQAGSHSKF